MSFTLDSGLELELLLFLLLESLMYQEPQNISVDTIYNYTESHIKSLEESITRIDARFSTFIGFSGVLIRIALDLENHSVIRFLVCLFSVIVIIIGALGLVAKQRGSVLAPSALMEDKYFYETEVYQKCLIINDRIKLTEEYEGVIKNKGKTDLPHSSRKSKNTTKEVRNKDEVE